MQKYLVVSYDDDQQQWFWDYVAQRPQRTQWPGSASGALMSSRLMQLHSLTCRALRVI
jgi:hypothetical protein